MHILGGPFISPHPHAAREYGPLKELALHTNSRKVTSPQHRCIKTLALVCHTLQDLFLIFLLLRDFLCGWAAGGTTSTVGWIL